MYVVGRGRTQLRHLGRQLLGLTWKQKLQNVLLEKYPYTEWWGDGRSHCKVPGNICMPRGNAKPGTHFSLRILRMLNFFVWGQRLEGVSGPCHLCGPTVSTPQGRKVIWKDPALSQPFNVPCDPEKAMIALSLMVPASQGQGACLGKHHL